MLVGVVATWVVASVETAPALAVKLLNLVFRSLPNCFTVSLIPSVVSIYPVIACLPNCKAVLYAAWLGFFPLSSAAIAAVAILFASGGN
jgi:hypothetical protein